MGVLGQKTVAGMNRIHIRDFRRADDAVNAQIAFRGSRFADTDRLVGHLDMHRVGVNLGIHRDRADVQFLAGADDADGNFSAVGDQDFFKHGLDEMRLKNRFKTDEL